MLRCSASFFGSFSLLESPLMAFFDSSHLKIMSYCIRISIFYPLNVTPYFFFIPSSDWIALGRKVLEKWLWFIFYSRQSPESKGSSRVRKRDFVWCKKVTSKRKFVRRSDKTKSMSATGVSEMGRRVNCNCGERRWVWSGPGQHNLLRRPVYQYSIETKK